MAKIPDFHSTGIEDGSEVVFHNQSACPVGQALKKSGTSLPGQGYFRTLCKMCQDIGAGSPGSLPL
jgi:hypothetical protein